MTQPVHAASVALFQDSEILLIERAFPPYAGYWTLPGGRCEAGESAEAAVRREIFEEIGVAPGLLNAVTIIETGHASGFRLAVFAGALPKNAQIRTSAEIAAWMWGGVGAEAGLRTTPGLADVLALARKVMRRS